jgi:anti-anti-sigma regulatory factor
LKNTVEIEVDAIRNLARLRYSGTVKAAQMKVAVEEIEGLLPQLKPGFAVLVDLTKLDVMELDCVPYLTKIMDLCKAQGVRLVVRVIPDRHKDIGLNILSLTHYRGKVQIVTCDTLAEAERALK